MNVFNNYYSGDYVFESCFSPNCEQQTDFTVCRTVIEELCGIIQWPDENESDTVIDGKLVSRGM